jgi:hypothetical protein
MTIDSITGGETSQADRSGKRLDRRLIMMCNYEVYNAILYAQAIKPILFHFLGEEDKDIVVLFLVFLVMGYLNVRWVIDAWASCSASSRLIITPSSIDPAVVSPAVVAISPILVDVGTDTIEADQHLEAGVVGVASGDNESMDEDSEPSLAAAAVTFRVETEVLDYHPASMEERGEEAERRKNWRLHRMAAESLRSGSIDDSNDIAVLEMRERV